MYRYLYIYSVFSLPLPLLLISNSALVQLCRAAYSNPEGSRCIAWHRFKFVEEVFQEDGSQCQDRLHTTKGLYEHSPQPAKTSSLKRLLKQISYVYHQPHSIETAPCYHTLWFLLLAKAEM